MKAVKAEKKPVVVNPVVPRPKPRVLPPVAEFKMATFNILGNVHTGPGGHHSWLRSGPQRMGGVLSLLNSHDVSVVGIQQSQPIQRQAFQARAGGWSMYPGLSMGRRAGENSVAWRDDTWEMVKPGLIGIPYFFGRIRPMPYVLLCHKTTGVQADSPPSTTPRTSSATCSGTATRRPVARSACSTASRAPGYPSSSPGT